jgi:hypothetical protein
MDISNTNTKTITKAKEKMEIQVSPLKLNFKQIHPLRTNKEPKYTIHGDELRHNKIKS